MLTEDIINAMDIDEVDKMVVQNRYIKMISHMEVATKFVTFTYSTLSLFITVGSILVPALLSVDKRPFTANGEPSANEQSRHENDVFWATWGISLIVSLSNGIIKLFSYDKTYVIRHLRFNELKREGWLFFTLAGPYRDSTHKDAVKLFIQMIEVIKSNQIREEYLPQHDNNKEYAKYVDDRNTELPGQAGAPPPPAGPPPPVTSFPPPPPRTHTRSAQPLHMEMSDLDDTFVDV
jgi:hypothetical protein